MDNDFLTVQTSQHVAPESYLILKVTNAFDDKIKSYAIKQFDGIDRYCFTSIVEYHINKVRFETHDTRGRW